MYNNQPPFRPPIGVPPFPPNFAPNGMPPFPPQGFVRPPFAPTLPTGLTPPPVRPSSTQSTPRPSHPGLGLPPLPTGLPAPPHLPQIPKPSTNFVKEVKTTSVFVGGISPGISDDTLKDLLNACGPLHELKRVVGASGKPQAFGFALFESPEVVMRCIRCLNGVELPDMTPEGKNPPKPLVVKVDEKTREFLDEFEQTLGRTDDDETADSVCRRAIAHIVARLKDPTVALPPDVVLQPGRSSSVQVVVPAHLQDLKEGDLPENQRVAVLDQIAVFREAAARKDQEKRRLDEERERMKQSGALAGPSDYGYGHRALREDTQRQARQWQQRNGSAHDPQSYSEPVQFVKAERAEAKVDSDRTDEEEEQIRLQQRDRERDIALRELERRVESRERGRIESLNREMASRKSLADLEEKTRKQIGEKLELWDDDEKIAQGREWFYNDREHWRSQRQPRRVAEYQDDVRDRQAEQDEIKLLEQESEEFLQKQLAEMAELEEQQKRRGLLTEDAAPVKLALDSAAVEAKPKDEPVEPALPRPKVAFDAEEDEEIAARQRKRTLVKLEDGDAAMDDGITEAGRIAQRNAQLLGLRRRVPRDRRQLWAERIRWRAITETLLSEKLIPFVSNQMKHFLGEVDEDLVDFVVEQLREQSGPDDMLRGLEPILAEEAVAFTIDLWRLLVFESMAFEEGLETGSLLLN